MKKTIIVISIMLVMSLMLTSCGFTITPLDSTDPAMDGDAINTAVALTVAASIQGGAVTLTPELQQIPTNTPMPLPSATPQPLDTIAPLPSATSTEDNCNRAKFVENGDITIPDGSVLLPNTSFIKTWRVTNTGTCTWNTNYSVVFSGGDQMSAPSATNLPAAVPPGATVDVSVQMKSPAAEGEYAGNYMLRSDGGIVFGTGASHMAPIYVSIEVVALQVMPGLIFGGDIIMLPLETLVYDFGANFCSGKWLNASDPGLLDCPGDKTDASGFVVSVDSPKLQDGNKVNGVGLFTHPQWIDGGSVAGIFPLLNVENGMKFRATLGCGYGGAACNVRFYLRYQIEGGTLKTLNQWDIKYADAPVKVDQDLAALAGKKINFVLQVVTNGSSAQDWAYWVNPRVVK